MQAYFWTFEKRVNSTKQPDDEAGEPATINLKSGCSITAPVIEISTMNNVVPYCFNYAYIEEFGRYYFVNDWTFDRGIWGCSMVVDPLASYRENILMSKQYIARSAVRDVGASVMDNTPLTLTSAENVTEVGSRIFTENYNDGFFVVGIVGPSAGMGAVNYYLFKNAAELAKLLNLLLDDVDWLNVTDITEELLKCLANPMQYITTCRFFPFALDAVVVERVTIKLGFWDTGLSGTRLKSFSVTKQGSVSVPKHPQYGELGSYTNLAPYSHYTAEIEPFGTFPLDPVKLCESETILYKLVADIVTGEASLSLYNDTDGLVAKHFGRACVEIPIAASSSSVIGAAVGVAGQALGGVAGNMGLSKLANGITGVTGAVLNSMSNVTSRGGQTSRAFMTEAPKLHAHFQRIDPDYVQIFGHACCNVAQLDSRRGYNLCVEPKVEIPGTVTEQESIMAHMSGGFYVE